MHDRKVGQVQTPFVSSNVEVHAVQNATEVHEAQLAAQI